MSSPPTTSSGPKPIPHRHVELEPVRQDDVRRLEAVRDRAACRERVLGAVEQAEEVVGGRLHDHAAALRDGRLGEAPHLVAHEERGDDPAVQRRP
jgi:hypothetical protein